MKRPALTVLSALVSLPLLSIALPASANESVDTPNNRTTCGGPSSCNVRAPLSGDRRMRLRVKLGRRIGVKKIKTGDIGLDGGETGQEVALRSYNAVCEAARDAKFPCLGEIDGVTCGKFQTISSCCSGGDTSVAAQATCRANGGRSFNIARAADDDRVDVSSGTTQVRGVLARSNAGNTIRHDILPSWVGRVDPNGVDGDVDFSVTHNQIGPPNPATFTVDTTGKTDKQLHEAICAGAEALPLSPQLQCRVLNKSHIAQHPEEFRHGISARVKNLEEALVTEFGATGLEGQEIIQEQGFKGEPLPALSAWGVALLSGMLIAYTGSYLRRKG